jgi:hypothetical protein
MGEMRCPAGPLNEHSCRRQSRDFIEFTHRSIQAWIEKTAPPSLVPVG